MRLCTRCILPESYPGILFNDEGCCNYCLAYKKKEYLGESSLKEVLESYRNKSGDYDAIVGVSGGRDSAYALYYLVKVAKMKVLAYSIDNGFVTEQAKENMHTMADALGVKLIIEKNDLPKRCSEHNFRAWIRKPATRLIVLSCTICNSLIEIGLRKIAKNTGTSLIVEGGGIEIAFTGLWAGAIAGSRMKSAISLAAKTGLDMLKNPMYLSSPRCVCAEMRAFLYLFMPFNMIQKIVYPGQRIIQLFDYLKFDESLIHAAIENELGWKRSKDLESPWRFDCRLSFLRNFLFREIFGFTEKNDFYSMLIREGVMTREEALERTSRDNHVPLELLIAVCDDIGISYNNLKTASKELQQSK